MKYFLIIPLVFCLTSISLGKKPEQSIELIHFSAEWCPPCNRLNEEIFKSQDKRSKDFLKKFTKIEHVDIDEEKKKKNEYRVKIVPTTILVFKRKEKTVFIYKYIGYKNKNNYIKILNNAIRTIYSLKW
jgi:thiol-disulfide isomerase/thioredoxin